MSTLTANATDLRKPGFAQRWALRLFNWVREEYRLTTYAHIRWKAENGDAGAQYVLGTMCDNGKAVFQTSTEAVKWYQKAAFQGVAPAQLALGLKYLHGRGVATNEGEALLWLRKAAEQGQVEAQFELGNLFQEGRGATRDLLQAGKWYRKAADAGHAGARNNFQALSSGAVAFPGTEEPPAEAQKRVA